MKGNQQSASRPPGWGDTTDLALQRWGFRFANCAVERRYHEWMLDRRVPLIRVGMLASASGYVVYLLTVGLLEPASFGAILPAVVAFLGLLTMIFAVTYIVSLHRVLVPVTVLANCLSGLLLLWQIHNLIQSPDRFALAPTAVLIPVMFGFCVYQLSPAPASFASLPFIGLSMVILYRDFQAGDISVAMAGSLAAMQAIACNTGVFVSWVIELNNRRTFRKDQIIELQRNQLRMSRDAIRRYVPPSVADLIIRGQAESIDTPVRRRITILFADIAGFTEVSDRIEPEDLTALLVEFFSGMAEKVEESGGTLNEFTGDGLMALFGAPETMEPEQQAVQAIRAARDMQALMETLNARWLRRGIGLPLQMRIGINTGTVSVGSYGSQGRMTYTALGLQTNIASRLEKAAEPGSIIVSDATFRLASHAFRLEPRGNVLCKGVHYPVPTYCVVAEAEPGASGETSTEPGLAA